MTRRPSRPISLIVLALGATQALADTGPLFDAPMIHALKYKPQNVATGDLDGDGDVDLAAVSVADSRKKLILLRNNGDGVYSPPELLEVGDDLRARRVVVADVNDDGLQDLIMHLDEGIGVRLNGGDGGFDPLIESAVDWQPTGDRIEMKLTDLNGDGDRDLVLTQEKLYLRTFFGDSEGSFGDQHLYRFGDEEEVWDIARGDLDGDGDVDLVALVSPWSTQPPQRLIVLQNGGDGTFVELESHPLDGCPGSVVVVDFDDDGRLDVVAGLGLDISLFHGNGDGTLQAPRVYPTELVVERMACGDVNGDGLLDFVIDEQARLAVLLNNGDGGFTASEPAHVSSHAECTALTLEDLDGDGDLDIASLRHDTDDEYAGGICIILNPGDGAFAQVPTYDISGRGDVLIAAELNNEPGTDLVGAHHWSDAIAIVHGHPSQELSAPYIRPALGAVTALASGDFDGNGWNDIAAVHQDGGSGAFLRNLGDGNTFPGTLFSTGVEPQNVFSGDVDLDGDLDLIIDGGDPNMVEPGRISVLRNRGDGTLDDAEVFEFAVPFTELAVGDLDGDGDQDAAALAGAPWRLLVFENTGGAFVQAAESAHPWSSSGLRIADLNGDDLGDIVASHSGDGLGGILVHLNLGDFVFSESTVADDVCVHLRELRLADLNRDGALDVVCVGLTTDYYRGGVSVYLNDGLGELGAPVHYFTDRLTWQIAAGDFDGNGANDIAVAGQAGQDALVLFNQHDACLGDLDGDHDIDQDDLGILLAAYEVDDSGDIDADGVTGQPDLGLLLASFGRICD